MTTYCDYCNAHPEDVFNHTYHATQYGFPLADDNLLFERLVLEINQAGLSWLTILKKAENFRRAYDGFDLPTVAGYGEADRAPLLANPGIIRNRLKVNAAIENARRILAMYPQYGSFKGWLDANYPLTKEEWTKLFKKNLRLYRRRDCERVPDEHRLPARRAHARLPGLCRGGAARPALDEIVPQVR